MGAIEVFMDCLTGQIDFFRQNYPSKLTRTDFGEFEKRSVFWW